MRTVLTPPLLKFLTTEGYQYCFSKTTLVQTDSANVCVTLTPVKFKPVLKVLPPGYDTFFSIRREPLRLAKGVDDTLILINVNTPTMLKYMASILNNIKTKTYAEESIDPGQ